MGKLSSVSYTEYAPPAVLLQTQEYHLLVAVGESYISVT